MSNICRYFSILLISSITACTTVKPWEHENLSRPEMALSSTPLTAAIENHIYSSKEGTSSHSTVVGGGCDCN